MTTDQIRTIRYSKIGLVIGAVAIGFSPIFFRLAHLDPIVVGFWRVVLALPVLLILHIVFRSPKALDGFCFSEFKLFFFAGFFFAGDLAAWLEALHFTTVTQATLLCNMAPILMIIQRHLFYREKITMPILLVIIAIISGCGLLIRPNLHLSSLLLLGNLFGLLAAFFVVGYINTVKKIRSNRSISMWDTMLFSSIVCAILLGAVSLLLKEPFFGGGIETLLALLALALISHVIGQGLIAYALAHLSPSFVVVVLMAQVIIASVFSWIFFGESLVLAQIFGLVIATTGLTFIMMGRVQ